MRFITIFKHLMRFGYTRCNIETKILEKIILTKVVAHSDVEKQQFGFLERSFHYIVCWYC